MSEGAKAPPANYLVDTGVFISWYRGEKAARDFFRRPPGRLYYSKQTRKELLRPPISNMESRTVKRFLRRFRMVNLDDTIARAFSDLLAKYPYLRDHLPDALIAATAWAKKMILVTTNPRHFKPIKEIRVTIFPDEFARTEV